jgi:hypothetical protein
VVTLQVSTGNVPPPPPPPGDSADDRDLGYGPNGEVFDQFGQPVTPSLAPQPSESAQPSRTARSPQPGTSSGR